VKISVLKASHYCACSCRCHTIPNNMGCSKQWETALHCGATEGQDTC